MVIVKLVRTIFQLKVGATASTGIYYPSYLRLAGAFALGLAPASTGVPLR